MIHEEIKIDTQTLNGIPIIVTIKNNEIKRIEFPQSNIIMDDVYPTLMIKKIPVKSMVNNYQIEKYEYSIGGSRYLAISKPSAMMLLSAMSN